MNPASAAIPAIKHIYGLPYHTFEQDNNGPAAAGDSVDDQNSDVVETESVESHVSITSSMLSMGPDFSARDKVMLRGDFFIRPTSLEMPPDEWFSDASRSQLSHHGDIYQCAEYLDIPSLTAAITADASKIFQSGKQPHER